MAVLGPNHDSLLIEAPTPDIEGAIQITTQAMINASKEVLDGYEVSVDVKRFMDRYRDPEHAEMWNRVWDIIARIDSEHAEIAKLCR